MKLNLSDRPTAQLPDASVFVEQETATPVPPTPVPPATTDLASAITLLNALRDRLSASGAAEHPLFT